LGWQGAGGGRRNKEKKPLPRGGGKPFTSSVGLRVLFADKKKQSARKKEKCPSDLSLKRKGLRSSQLRWVADHEKII